MKPTRILAGALLTALLLMPASAEVTSETPAYDFSPGHYAVDRAHTTVHFRVSSLFGAYQGDFIEPTGEVLIEPDRPRHAHIDISFPVSRLTTGDASTDQMLKSASFFDSDRYPTVRFTADDAPIGNDQLKIDGHLTMHGQTRPLSITARFAGIRMEEGATHPSLHFTGEASVKRSEFGMGFGRPFVANNVDLTIDATFRLS